MAFNLAGGATGSLAEVDTATLAQRTTPRYTDPGTLGHYAIAVDNGTTQMAAALAANSPIFSWRWGNANIGVVYSVKIGMWAAGTGFTAGRFAFDLIQAIGGSYTVSDTGGTAVTLTGNNAKKRQSYGTTLLTDARISATATLTAGTRTLNTTPIGKITGVAPVTTNFAIVAPNTTLWGRDTPEQPGMIFAQNEGFVIQATVPATGVWFFHVAVDWLEIASY